MLLSKYLELQFSFLPPINSSSQSIYDPPFGCSFNKDGLVFWNDQQTFYNEPEYRYLCKGKLIYNNVHVPG